MVSPARQPVARDAFDTLPAPVASLLNARLTARVDREAALPITPWIDRGHASLREAQTAWRDAAREAAHVPEAEWDVALLDASRLAVAHLVQPAATLAATAFADDLKADASELGGSGSPTDASGPRPPSRLRPISRT